MHHVNDSHYLPKLRRVATLLLVVATACGTASTEQDEPRPLVIATTSIIGDVVSNIVGDQVDLTTLLAAGVDPHDFALSSQQVASISAADLIIANGLDLEEGLEGVLAQAESEGVPVLRLAVQLDPLPMAEEAGHEDGELEEDEHEEEAGAEGDSEHELGKFDPHFWQDPLRMVNAVDLIASQLDTLGLEGVSTAAEYKGRIEAAHEEIEGILVAVPSERRLLVTNHDAFGYFAARYGFTIIGTIIPGGSTLATPSSAEMAGLVEVINEYEVPAIFVENTASTALADSLAAEIGRPVAIVPLVSDALGESGSETGTYLDMIVFNARAIAEALS